MYTNTNISPITNLNNYKLAFFLADEADLSAVVITKSLWNKESVRYVGPAIGLSISILILYICAYINSFLPIFMYL